MANVLIVGAAGFVGGHLTRSMARQHAVIGLGRGAEPADLPSNVRWINHDLSEPSLPADMPSTIDVVVHLAQSRKFRDFPVGAEDVFSINVRSTFELALWARRAGARKFILASTGGLCGTSDQPITEKAPYIGGGRLGLYFAAKYGSELLLQALQPIISHVILRPFFIYGVGQDPTMLISRLIDSVKNGSPIQLQGENGIKINPIHVDDCVRAIERATTVSESHLLNVAGPEVLTLRQIGDAIGRCVGRLPVFAVDKTLAPGNVVGDTSRMTAVLGAPSIRFEEGVAALCGFDVGRVGEQGARK